MRAVPVWYTANDRTRPSPTTNPGGSNSITLSDRPRRAISVWNSRPRAQVPSAPSASSKSVNCWWILTRQRVRCPSPTKKMWSSSPTSKTRVRRTSRGRSKRSCVRRLRTQPKLASRQDSKPPRRFGSRPSPGSTDRRSPSRPETTLQTPHSASTLSESCRSTISTLPIRRHRANR